MWSIGRRQITWGDPTKHRHDFYFSTESYILKDVYHIEVNTLSMIDEAKHLIATGKLDETFDLLLSYTKDFSKSIEYQLLSISSWYNRLKKSDNLGIEVEQKEYQKILKSLLELLGEIESTSRSYVKNEEIVLFQKDLSLKLLPIPNLEKRIATFGFRNVDKSECIQLKLFFYNRDIDIDFLCPLDLKVRELKNEILNHFNLQNYVDHSPLIKLTWILFANNRHLEFEEKSIEEYKLKAKDFIKVRFLIEIEPPSGIIIDDDMIL